MPSIGWKNLPAEKIALSKTNAIRKQTTAEARGLRLFVAGAPVRVPPVPLRVSTQREIQQLTQSEPKSFWRE